MALIIFKYCLPLVLGYILFVGISGQLMPFRKPSELAERPSWLLGLWTATAVTLCLWIGLHMAYQMTLSEIEPMLKPSAMLLGAILMPGLIAYFLYAHAVRREIAAASLVDTGVAITTNDVELVDFAEIDSSDDGLEQIFDDIDNYEEVIENDVELRAAENDNTFADDFAANIVVNDSVFESLDQSIVDDSIFEEQLDNTQLVTGIEHMQWSTDAPAALVESTQIANNDLVTGIEHMYWSDTEQEAAVSAQAVAENQKSTEHTTGIEHMQWSNAELAAAGFMLAIRNKDSDVTIEEEAEEAIDAIDLVTDNKHMELASPNEEANYVEAEYVEQAATAKTAGTPVSAAAESEEDASVPALVIDANITAEPEAPVQDPELIAELAMMRHSLASEVALREEIEKHLRITRKGLSALESEQHQIELQKADEIIEVEEKLEVQIKRTSRSEAHAERLEKQKVALETQMRELKNDVVEAKREIRISTAARAKALATANKSVAFAQQAMKERASFEAQAKDAELALHKRQETISSLISALEKEKQRTQGEVASMAKQLVLHEKQLQARRSIEQAARKVDGKLSTRLVKKIATGANKSAA